MQESTISSSVSPHDPKTGTGSRPASAVDPQTGSQPRSGEFLDRLEAVRGIAAMMVAASHAIVICPSFGWEANALLPFLQCFTNGRAAVTLFFVLSGLVLGLSLRRSRESFPVEVCSFYIRRFFRIYPAFLLCTVTVLLYALFGLVGGEYASAGPWYERFYSIYREPLTASRLFSNLVFGSKSYNLVIWTLKVEMVCSLFLPFMHRVIVRASTLQRLLLFCGLIAVGFIPNTYSTGFLFMFMAGYMLPMLGPDLLAGLRKNSKLAACVALVAFPVLLGCRWVLGDPVITRVGLIIEAAAATVLIGNLLYGTDFRVHKLLDHPVAKFYGRISYSFYLWHMFCLLVVVKPVLAYVPKDVLWSCPLLWNLVLFALSTLVATLIASASYRWVEKPMVDLSKALCRRISARRGRA